MLRLALIAILLLGGCASRPADSPASPPTILEEALTWLPGDTETVIVAQGPFSLVASENPGEDGDAAMTLENASRMLATGGLGALREGRFILALGGASLKLCLEGSRRFRHPRESGPMRYQGSSVLVVEDPASLDPVSKDLKEAAEQVLTERGHSVFLFHEKLGEDEWTVLVARPKKNLLLCATDRNYLCEMLDRIAHPSTRRALSTDLPEWKLLDSSARVWALRHYDRRREQDEDAGPIPPDATSTGLVYFASADGRTARLRMSGKDEDTYHRVEEALEDPDGHLKARLARDGGTIDVTAACDSPQAVETFLIALLGFLGHVHSH